MDVSKLKDDRILSEWLLVEQETDERLDLPRARERELVDHSYADYVAPEGRHSEPVRNPHACCHS